MSSFKRLVAAFVMFVAATAAGFLALPRTVATSIVQSSKVEQTVVYEDSVITNVVKKAVPSVVTVSVSLPARAGNGTGLSLPSRVHTNIPKALEASIGSGFVVSADGYVITNRHVVDDATVSYQVVGNDGATYDVSKIYRDPLNDLAILKINPSAGAALTPLSLGDSSSLQLGQMVVAIGTPMGQLQNTITHGIISGLGRGIVAGSPFEGSVEKLDNIIQTDAAINPGNSGGPLLNSSGQVIGVSTAVAEGGQNIGFAIPVDAIKDLLAYFSKNGSSFARPYLGIRYYQRSEVPEGADVAQVMPNSPAEKAGLKAGDTIVKLGGQKVEGADDQQLTKLLLEKKIGDTVNLTVVRGSQTIEKTVVLGAAS